MDEFRYDLSFSENSWDVRVGKQVSGYASTNDL